MKEVEERDDRKFPVTFENFTEYMSEWEVLIELSQDKDARWEWIGPRPWTKKWFEEKPERKRYLKPENIKIFKKYWTMCWCWVVGREEVRLITETYQEMSDLLWFDVWVRNYVFLLPEWDNIKSLKVEKIEMLKRKIKWINKRTLQLLWWYIKERWIDWKYLMEDLAEYVEKWGLLDIDVIINMLKEDIYPTKNLLEYVFEREDWREGIKQLKDIREKYKKNWWFDPKDPIHIDLEYIEFRRFIDWAYKDGYWKWYKIYLELLKQKEGRRYINERYYEIAAEESLVAYNFIEGLKEEYWFVNVFANMSYGKVIVWPFEEELEKDEKINYNRVRIWSTECHERLTYLKKDLFSKEDIKKMFRWPVIILDWTKNESIPDSNIGFKSWFYVLNKVLADIYQDRRFIEENYSEEFRKAVERESWYEELHDYLREIVISNKLYRFRKYFRFFICYSKWGNKCKN